MEAVGDDGGASDAPSSGSESPDESAAPPPREATPLVATERDSVGQRLRDVLPRVLRRLQQLW